MLLSELPSKDEENKMQMERGRAGNFLPGFPMAVSVYPHQEKSAGQKQSQRWLLGTCYNANPKLWWIKAKGPEPLLNPIRTVGFFFPRWSWAK